MAVLAGTQPRGYQRGLMARPIRILGIDPGLRRTGWGVVDVDGNTLRHVACGSHVVSDRLSLGERLVAIHDALVAHEERIRAHFAVIVEYEATRAEIASVASEQAEP